MQLSPITHQICGINHDEIWWNMEVQGDVMLSRQGRWVLMSAYLQWFSSLGSYCIQVQPSEVIRFCVFFFSTEQQLFDLGQLKSNWWVVKPRWRSPATMDDVRGIFTVIVMDMEWGIHVVPQPVHDVWNSGISVFIVWGDFFGSKPLVFISPDPNFSPTSEGSTTIVWHRQWCAMWGHSTEFLEAFFKAEEGGDLDGVEEWKEIRESRSAAFAGSSAIGKLWRDGFRATQFFVAYLSRIAPHPHTVGESFDLDWFKIDFSFYNSHG